MVATTNKTLINNTVANLKWEVRNSTNMGNKTTLGLALASDKFY
jgi:hypothetical protein